MTKQYLYIALCCLLFVGVALTQSHKPSWAVDTANLQIWNAEKVDWWVSMDDQAQTGSKQGCEIHWLYDDALDLSLNVSDKRRLYYNFVISKERTDKAPSVNYSQADSAYLVIDKVKNPLAISRGQSSQVIMALPSNLNDVDYIKSAKRLLLKIGGTIYNFPLENADENFSYFQKCMDTLNIQIASSSAMPTPVAVNEKPRNKPSRATQIAEAPPPKPMKAMPEPMFMPQVETEVVRAPEQSQEQINAPTQLVALAPPPVPMRRDNVYPEIDNQTLYHDVKKLDMFSASSERVIVSQQGSSARVEETPMEQPIAPAPRSSKFDPSIYGQPVEAEPLMPAPVLERPSQAVGIEQRTSEELEVPPFAEEDRAVIESVVEAEEKPSLCKNSKQFDSMLKDIEHSETKQKKEARLKDQLSGGGNACGDAEYNGENTAIIQNLTRKLRVLEREKEELRTKMIGSGSKLIQDVAACNTPIEEDLDEPLSDEVIEKFEDTINKLRAENELLREASIEGDGEESSALEDEIDGLQQQINGLIERNDKLQDENFDLQKGIEAAVENAEKEKQGIDKVKELLSEPAKEAPVKEEASSEEEDISEALTDLEILAEEDLDIREKFEDVTGDTIDALQIDALQEDFLNTEIDQP